MISDNIWIYTRTEIGYNLFAYNESCILPDHVKIELNNIFTKTGMASMYDAPATSLRFAPIADYYVITVIFRNILNPNHDRLHDCYVNFLYSPIDTKLIFDTASDFKKELENCIKKSKEIADGYGFQNIDITTFLSDSVHSDVSDTKLKAFAMAADRVAKKERSTPIYIGMNNNNNMHDVAIGFLEKLPVRLRSKLSIFINAYSTTETVDTDLVFLSNAELDNIRSTQSRGFLDGAVTVCHDEFSWVGPRARAEDLVYIIKNGKTIYADILKLMVDCDDIDKFLEVTSTYVAMLNKTISKEQGTLKIIEIAGRTTVKAAIKNGYKLTDSVDNIKKKKAYKNYPDIIEAVKLFEQSQLKEISKEVVKPHTKKSDVSGESKTFVLSGAVTKETDENSRENINEKPNIENNNSTMVVMKLVCFLLLFLSLLLKITVFIICFILKDAKIITGLCYILLLIGLQFGDFLAYYLLNKFKTK